MRYTHVDLSVLCVSINKEITNAGGLECLMVKANGNTTSIFTLDKSNIKIPLLEDIARDEGYRYLQGVMFALRSKISFSEV